MIFIPRFVHHQECASNTIRLARAPLAGAFKLAASSGIVAVNPLTHTPQPKARGSVPRHWSPEQAREFLSLMERDRTYPVWAFLMGAGRRIGELLALRWGNVNLKVQVETQANCRQPVQQGIPTTLSMRCHPADWAAPPRAREWRT